jgi:hypothetical protein
MNKINEMRAKKEMEDLKSNMDQLSPNVKVKIINQNLY